MTNGTTPTTAPVPPRHQWPALALELTMDPTAATAICAAYSTTEAAVMALLDDEAFRSEVRAARALLKEPDGVYRAKARALAGEQLAVLHRLAVDDNVPPAIRTKAIELTARLAELDPATKKSDSREEQRGVQFTMVFGPGLPGMAGQGPMTVDAIPTHDDN